MYNQQRRRKKVVKKDRLSNLPNEILIIIISLLTTKEAIRSSILSKRWKSLWLSSSVFEFVEENFHSEEEFTDFVDDVLLGHNTPLLNKIHISTRKSDYEDLFSSVIKWMRAALGRNTTDLDVEFGDCTLEGGSDVTCFLAEKLFSYNKLVALRLHGDIFFCFPKNSSAFPNLKDLLLDKIVYEDNNTLPNLLSSCPVLEEMYISRNRWDSIVTLDIKTKSLIRLTVDCLFEDFEDPETLCQNFKTIIDAPKLEVFDISCFTTRNYEAKDLSSLVKAKLKYYDPVFEPLDIDETKRLLRFLSAISNVELLTIKSNTFKALMRTESWKLPNFRNLTFLNVKFYNIQERTKFPEWKYLIEILKSSPVLEILHFRRKLDLFSQGCEEINWDVVPSCFPSNLKSVKFNFYYDSIDDMAAMEFFLINAKALEEMFIMCTDSIRLYNDISKPRIMKVRLHAKLELVERGVKLSFP